MNDISYFLIILQDTILLLQMYKKMYLIWLQIVCYFLHIYEQEKELQHYLELQNIKIIGNILKIYQAEFQTKF